jgi:hypothetical protein
VHFRTLDMCGGARQYACEFSCAEVIDRPRAKIAIPVLTVDSCSCHDDSSPLPTVEAKSAATDALPRLPHIVCHSREFHI